MGYKVTIAGILSTGVPNAFTVGFFDTSEEAEEFVNQNTFSDHRSLDEAAIIEWDLNISNPGKCANCSAVVGFRTRHAGKWRCMTCQSAYKESARNRKREGFKKHFGASPAAFYDQHPQV